MINELPEETQHGTLLMWVAAVGFPPSVTGTSGSEGSVPPLAHKAIKALECYRSVSEALERD